MENVTDRTSNPFGMRPPCRYDCVGDGGSNPDDAPGSAADPSAVFGYGDANADVHVIGDHPGVHGGRTTGVPFTDDEGSRALLELLTSVGLLADSGDAPEVDGCFLSYLHMCCPPPDGEPTADEYAELEPFFDAELRAIAAHVLVPVGERATAHVIEQYTARARDTEVDMARLHATELRGSGWLVFPLEDPEEWTDADREAAEEALRALLERDYRQTTDLGRFLATDDPYLVR